MTPTQPELTISRVVRPSSTLLEELAAYDHEAFGTAGLRTYDLAVAIWAGAVYVGRVGGTIVASCQLIRMADRSDLFWVVGFYVRPDWQGMRLGSRLLDWVLAEVHRLGGRGLELTVSQENKTAMQLYLSAGFKEVVQVADFYGPGEDRLVLRHEGSAEDPRFVG